MSKSRSGAKQPSPRAFSESYYLNVIETLEKRVEELAAALDTASKQLNALLSQEATARAYDERQSRKPLWLSIDEIEAQKIKGTEKSSLWIDEIEAQKIKGTEESSLSAQYREPKMPAELQPAEGPEAERTKDALHKIGAKGGNDDLLKQREGAEGSLEIDYSNDAEVLESYIQGNATPSFSRVFELAKEAHAALRAMNAPLHSFADIEGSDGAITIKFHIALNGICEEGRPLKQASFDF
jgi:hypothetical protein